MESPPLVLHLLFGLLIPFGLAARLFGYRISRFILAAPGWVVGAALLGTLTYLATDNWLLAILAGWLLLGFIGVNAQYAERCHERESGSA